MSLKRIILHWTGGNLIPNNTDKEHYHYLYAAPKPDSVVIVRGKYTPEDNIDCKDNKYAAHTGGLNTDSIGLAVCGMKDDNNNITKYQVEKLCSHCAVLCLLYGIIPDNETIMTHFEVGNKVNEGSIKKDKLTQKNIGKIDLSILPFDLKIKSYIVGDYLRNKIKWYYDRLK